MKKLNAFILLFVIVLADVLSAHGQNIVPLDSFRTNLQNITDNATTNYGIDGLEFSIVVNEGLAAETFYSGLRAPGIPVDTSKPWHYAQAVAGYTNYVALKLIQENKLTMDDSIGKHMNASAMGLDGSITVRQLIRHTSVLNDIWVPSQPSDCYSDIWNNNPGVLGCPGDLLSCFPADKPSPGVFDNNNTNLLVLQFLIDSITQGSYETEIENRIFTPMGMNNTYLSSCKAVTIDSINGIWTTNSEYANNRSYLRYFSTNGGNRSLISKSDEVIRFYRNLFQGKLLPPEVMDSVKTVIPGSTINQGSYSCARSILGFQGYNTDILQIVDDLGDTAVMYGKGGFGLNGHLTLHWPKKDWTFSFVHNDRSRVLQHRNLAVDLYCYLRDIDSIANSASVTKTIDASRVKCYPNPSKEVLNLELPSSVENYQFQIMDLSGRVLKTQFSLTFPLINIDFLASGTYILRITQGASSVKMRFVKE